MKKHLSALAVMALIAGSAALPQQPRQELEKTLNVSCGASSVAKTARSAVLASPQNRNRAYTEVSVSTTPGNCANNSKLFIASSSSGSHYKLVFLQEPTELQTGNGIKIVDWSHDDRLLLFEVIQWQYGSDARPEEHILIYDSQSGVFLPVRVDFVEKFGPGCVMKIDPLGFSSTNQAILEISARQDYHEEGAPLTPRCAEQKGLWSYDPSSYKVKPLPSGTRVEHWGLISTDFGSSGIPLGGAEHHSMDR